MYVTQRNSARKAIGKEFVPEGRLFYKQLSMRESDYNKFGTNSTSIDLKVRTLAPPSFNVSKDDLTVKIGDVFYTVEKVDSDGRYLFFYLHAIEGEQDEREDEESN
ncbi:head-tail adaptor protein [Lysinibacillus sp. LZ02]|uniref:head-tail adaptor protein n=1 Tax=Lysinibacillus sp. LZ02 TaxID=3420668 RepID=UPI003D35BD82